MRRILLVAAMILLLAGSAQAAPRPADVRAGLLGDVNLDGSVNILDFSIFALAYGSHRGQGNYNPLADLTRDGSVGEVDFAVFKLVYGADASAGVTR